MSPREFIDVFVEPEERAMIWLDNYNQDQLLVLQKILMRALTTATGSGDVVEGMVNEVKYDGRLVILDDGSRWEVDAFDATTSAMWSFGDQIVILRGDMFKLDEFEKISVTEEN